MQRNIALRAPLRKSARLWIRHFSVGKVAQKSQTREMYEVLWISVASLCTLYSGQWLLVACVASVVVQFVARRVASESALYILGALCSTRMGAKFEEQSLASLDMFITLGIASISAYFQNPQWISLIILELWTSVCNVPGNAWQRRGLVATAWVTATIWAHDVTFYTTLSMSVYFGVLHLANKST